MVRTLDARSSQNGNGNIYYEALRLIQLFWDK